MAREAMRAGGVHVVVTIDDEPFEVPVQTTVAAAAFRRYGVRGTRRSGSGEPRAALCGMGICQECRMTIDGRAHALACQTICCDGMVICTESAAS